jgi:MYXO-CTERM domain-containing protein
VVSAGPVSDHPITFEWHFSFLYPAILDSTFLILLVRSGMDSQLIKWITPISVCVAIFLAAPAAALACSYHSPQQQMEILDDDPDTEPDFPAPVVLELDYLNRGENPNANPVSSCADTGALGIDITGYDEDFGLVFEVEGQHPAPFDADERPLQFSSEHHYLVIWSDQDTRGESIDLTVTARWIDEFGRMGPASDPLHIIDDGAPLGCACSSTNSSTPPVTMVLMLLAMGLVVLRGRRTT